MRDRSSYSITNAGILHGTTLFLGPLPLIISFRCITCENLLDINMNVYLDGEGNPICANCMHNCSICNQPITDFAMMYGKYSLNFPPNSFIEQRKANGKIRKGNVS